MWKIASRIMLGAVLLWQSSVHAQTAPVQPVYDAAWAKSEGANANGMRGYTFVLLVTGPNRVPDGPERTEMFKGHFANMERLAAEKKLVAAGPMDGVDGWRGIFVFAVTDIEEVKKLVATDPVIIKGEMVAQYHKFFATTALMAINGIHQAITKK
jgi:uncharacterized protein YciI